MLNSGRRTQILKLFQTQQKQQAVGKGMVIVIEHHQNQSQKILPVLDEPQPLMVAQTVEEWVYFFLSAAEEVLVWDVVLLLLN